MTKVYFHVRCGQELLEDPEGEDYLDLAKAKRAAEIALHELLANDIDAERPVAKRTIELTGEDGQILATVALEATVKMEETGVNLPHRTDFAAADLARIFFS